MARIFLCTSSFCFDF